LNNKVNKKQIFTNININNHHPSLSLPVKKSLILQTVSAVLKGENCSINSLELNLVNNYRIRKVNKNYLNHDYFTDIITFPYISDKRSLDGEIFISLDTVKSNSIEFETSYKVEFVRVLIHGCLHMAGYGDNTILEKARMRKKENKYLRNVLR
jgi:probable rRNA maturation factor